MQHLPLSLRSFSVASHFMDLLSGFFSVTWKSRTLPLVFLSGLALWPSIHALISLALLSSGLRLWSCALGSWSLVFSSNYAFWPSIHGLCSLAFLLGSYGMVPYVFLLDLPPLCLFISFFICVFLLFIPKNIKIFFGWASLSYSSTGLASKVTFIA